MFRTSALQGAFDSGAYSCMPSNAVLRHRPLSFHRMGCLRSVLLLSVLGPTLLSMMSLAQSFSGVQQNINTTSLPEWSTCWAEGYNVDQETSVDELFSNRCTKDRLIFGCRPLGDTILTVAAQANRLDILTDTGRTNIPLISNSVGWYFNASWSIGFAGAGDAINRISCDYDFYTAQTNPMLRLCIQTKNGMIRSGFRCGNHTFLGADGTWERIILHSDAVTSRPTNLPTSATPSATPSKSPSTATPSRTPTHRPSSSPSLSPTARPSSGPTLSPSTSSPSVTPTTTTPSLTPSTTSPSTTPTTSVPSNSPSSSSPSISPSSTPSTTPSMEPTFRPTKMPRTARPSRSPTTPTTLAPSTSPTPMPSLSPTRTDQFFPGVRLGIDLGKYYKWQRCWEETYSTSNQTSSNDLLNTYCTKKRWMVACRSSDTPNIMVVAAQAPREDVTRQTIYNRVNVGAPPPIIPTVSNGVSWYWSTNNSFGFAPAGESIVLDECDVNDAPDRICIHFTNNYVSQGYRCGVEKRDTIRNWYRVILHTDEDTNDF